jgi:hypothetical protein
VDKVLRAGDAVPDRAQASTEIENREPLLIGRVKRSFGGGEAPPICPPKEIVKFHFRLFLLLAVAATSSFLTCDPH